MKVIPLLVCSADEQVASSALNFGWEQAWTLKQENSWI